MDKLIVTYFGINRLNFWGWVGAGTLLILISLFSILLAVGSHLSGDSVGAHFFALGAIYSVLLGIFGVLLQLYCSLLAEKLSTPVRPAPRSQEEDDDDTLRAPVPQKTNGFRS